MPQLLAFAAVCSLIGTAVASDASHAAGTPQSGATGAVTGETVSGCACGR